MIDISKTETQDLRTELFQEYYKIYPSIMHSFLRYDRYHEAGMIAEFIGDRKFKILDFGCGVGDYGMYFLRSGQTVDFYDFPEMANFVKFRLKKEKLKANVIEAVKSYDEVVGNYDLVIFGEVLEHLDNPLELLQICVDKKIPYLWTSAYPLVEDEKYLHRRGHSELAAQQRTDCLNLLEANYQPIAFEGGCRIWQRGGVK